MSIKHFHALSEKRKRIFLEHPEDFTGSEKLDGSNLIFGMTDGRLWTARKSTNEKFYDEQDWPDQLWAQNFRLAHRALKGMEDSIKTQLAQDFEASCELLSKLYPNTLLYRSPASWIVCFDGPAFMPIESNVTYDLKTSGDGKTITGFKGNETFRLTSLKPAQLDLPGIVEDLRQLPAEAQAAYLRGALADVASEFGHTKPEGWVITHKDGWSFKVVDTEWFTKMNTDNYAFRKLLFKTPGQKTQSVMDTYTRDVAGGMSAREAAKIAIAKLDQLRETYVSGGCLGVPTHIHQRNLEALASLYEQMSNVEAQWAGELSLM